MGNYIVNVEIRGITSKQDDHKLILEKCELLSNPPLKIIWTSDAVCELEYELNTDTEVQAELKANYLTDELLKNVNMKGPHISRISVNENDHEHSKQSDIFIVSFTNGEKISIKSHRFYYNNYENTIYFIGATSDEIIALFPYQDIKSIMRSDKVSFIKNNNQE